jgi:hypothetical protein
MNKISLLYNQIKPFLMVIPLILLGYVLYKNKGKFLGDTNQTKEDLSENLLSKIGVELAQRQALKQITLEVAHHMGTAYSAYNPKSWTENDEEVYNLLVVLNKTELQIVSLLYFEVYAKGRNLRTDLAKNLDTKYYKKLLL